ncbi:MAG: MMPL family transporter, partial [Planctomycetota bacterium]
RYREELAKLLPPKEAIARALGQVGNALAASALTTIIGLGMMVFAEFGKFRNGGPAIGLCLAVALLACVTLAPALLRAFGTAVFWPWGVGGGSAARRPGAAPVHGMEAGWECLGAADSAAAGARSFGLWDHISRLVLARPGAILLLAMALMAVPAWFGSDVPITYDLLNELQPDRPSVQGTQILRRHFLPGEIGPTTLVAHRPGADFLSEKGQQQIARLTKELYDFEWADLSDQVVRPIVSVRSLTEPLGDPPGTFNPLTAAGRQKLIVLKNPQTKRAFVSDAPPLLGSVTRFDLIFAYDPFSRESVALLGEVERRVQQMAADPASAWHGTEFAFSGATPGIRDLQAINQTDRIRIQVLVVAAVLLVLIAILGHPWICLGLVLSVVWGYLVTMGITRAVFAALHPDSFYGLDWKVPIFLFVILVAVGADYNIYLVTRALEEQRRRGSIEGLRVAMVRTGGIITSCGLIMAGTFAAMGAGTLRAMQELGFALALGVLLDTFVIRTVLVPAMLALMARRASAQEASSPSD